MALTDFQAEILRCLAELRRSGGESYVAGGVALNQLLRSGRRSRDIDLFHDTETALASSFAADRTELERRGFSVSVRRESRALVEAVVSAGSEISVVEWTRDSAFRFFPLMEDPVLGLTLHPFDLATNKVLAMAGRAEARDWIDVVTCDERLQPLGGLVWGACGKDEGYNPSSLLAELARTHYGQVELDALDFEAPRPDAAALGIRWHAMLREARAFCEALPPAEIGACVLDERCELFRGHEPKLRQELAAGRVRFHRGSIRGSWPDVLRS